MSEDAQAFIREFANICRIVEPCFELVRKGGETYMAINVGAMNPVYTQALSRLSDELADNPFAVSAFIKPKRPKNWLESPEVQLLQNLLSESLTIGKASLRSDFHSKAIPFLGGQERRITSLTNHIVYGRRGAGKSTLVLHSCFDAQKQNLPFAWIAIQQYRGRQDVLVIPQILSEIVAALRASTTHDLAKSVDALQTLVVAMESNPSLTLSDINIQMPVFARHLLPIVQKYGQIFLFIDDLHLLHPLIQPQLLATLYSFSRGNNIFLKITAIENLTRLYDNRTRAGLETPGDAQVVRLDYNLVRPDDAYEHIVNILESYVTYLGIPSLRTLVRDVKALERLTWVSAGVPRDALYIFNNALSKAIVANRNTVRVTDINMATADSMIEKERNISDDVLEEQELVRKVIQDLKTFCMMEVKCNAFLVHIEPEHPGFQLIRKIADLRFIHILHPGITPERAGEKYAVYLLDYAFYVGFRRAPSVREVVTKPETPPAKELRKLRRYDYQARIPLDANS